MWPPITADQGTRPDSASSRRILSDTVEPDTTGRYARLACNFVHEAAARIARSIAEDMAYTASGNVTVVARLARRQQSAAYGAI